MKFSSILFGLLVREAVCDVYLQTPPGSNNRLDEANRERANANRLFDSQNNNRGGYNVGKMTYYTGEKIPIAWTNQHGSDKYQMENSEFVIQYMCEPLVRDGTTTRTIPIKQSECYNYDCDTDVRFGRHESIDYYETCTHTEANKGLFTANQNLGNNPSAKNTRQNPQGTRSGLECPEERDYFPYWRPSPWIDALVFTADPARCAAIQAESQNVKSRFHCVFPDAFFENGGTLGNNFRYPINEDDCVETTEDDDNGDEHTAEWVEVPAHGVEAPACQQIEQTRANHLGNPGGRNLMELEWAIPETIAANSQCTMRLRYNITTADFPAYSSNDTVGAGVAAAESDKNNPNANNDPAYFALWETYGITYEEVEASFDGNDDDTREYVLENNPQPDAFGDLVKFDGDEAIKLQLAVNTAQFGRTFQDRTHYFIVEDRPADVPADAILKLQTVRGKRGNIVQTFPATEYFYHPENQYIKANEFVHFAWTGSNTNPNNNDGQGKQGTDRSNIVAQRVITYDKDEYSNYEWDMSKESGELDTANAGTSYPSYTKTPDGYVIPAELQTQLLTDTMGGMSEEILSMLATTRQTPHDYGNMEELDDAGTSINLDPQQVTKQGCWNYMGTRNNNFSNRAQKGKFCVTEGDSGDMNVGPAGVEWWNEQGTTGVKIETGSLGTMERMHIDVGKEGHSDVVSITAVDPAALTDEPHIWIYVEFNPQALSTSQLMHQPPCSYTPCDNAWEEVSDFEISDESGAYVASYDSNNVGSFKVVQTPNKGPIMALAVSVLAFICCLGWVLMNKCQHKMPECCRSRVPERFIVKDAALEPATEMGTSGPNWEEEGTSWRRGEMAD